MKDPLGREKFSIIESSCAGNRSCPFLSLITNNIQTGVKRRVRRRRRRRDSGREMYTRVEKCWVGKRSWAGSSSRTTRDFHRQTESCRMKPARKMNKIMKEGKIFESVDDDRRKRKRGEGGRERSAVSVVWQQGDETWWKNESNRERVACSLGMRSFYDGCKSSTRKFPSSVSLLLPRPLYPSVQRRRIATSTTIASSTKRYKAIRFLSFGKITTFVSSMLLSLLLRLYRKILRFLRRNFGKKKKENVWKKHLLFKWGWKYFVWYARVVIKNEYSFRLIIMESV